MTYYHPPRGLRRTTAPSLEPITLAETKLFLRVDHSDEDALIASLITAARESAESYTRRSFITQTWELSYNDAAPTTIMLPMRPVQNITSITIDGNNISSSLYSLNAAKDAVICETGLTGDIITITYVTGYGSSTTLVPAPIKQALLQHIASLYDDRSQEAIPTISRTLLQPYREVRL